jgi:hypothetical protein
MKAKVVEKILLGVLCSIAVSAWTDQARPGQARPGQEIRIDNASELEESLSIQAYGEVKDYYEGLGFSIPEDASPYIVFQDRISLNGRNVPDALGLFDPDSMSIRLVHYESEKYQQRGFLGVPPAVEVYYSIIVHEFAHYLNALVSPGLLPPADELIASTVQLELMDPQTRDYVLSCTEVERFTSCRDITLAAYWFGPDNFILACYSYSKEHPGMFIRYLEQTNPKIKDPLFID